MTALQTGGAPQRLTQLNATAIVELVRQRGASSRAEIAEALQLSPATVTRLTTRLLAAGLIVEQAGGVSRGGRRPVLLAYNPGAASLIGLDVGGTKIAGALSDLDGQIVTSRVVPTWPDDGRPRGLDAVLALIAELRASEATRGAPVRGIGIGVPGVTHHASGVVVWAPGLAWRDLALARIVAECYGIPTFIENDVNLATLGEYWRGAGQGIANLVGLFIGTGVGAGIVLHGQVVHGANEAAGEVGYLLLERAALDRTYPGFGAFELAVAGPGLAARMAARREHSAESKQTLDARGLFAAAEAGDPVATEVLAETLDRLALGVGNIACVLNPERIVLGGSVGLAFAPWYEALAARLHDRIPHVPAIVPAALGGNAGLLGAIALARQQTSEQVLSSA